LAASIGNDAILVEMNANLVEEILRMKRPTSRPSPGVEYEPVYGLPKHEVEEWLLRNPRLREKYEAELQRRLSGAETGEIAREKPLRPWNDYPWPST
jgi:hypothetical protein